MKALRLSFKSLANRKFTAALTVLMISTSVVLLIGVSRIQQSAKSSFQSTLSGTDLIVGARSGAVQLLLYSVFRIGGATNNFRWKSYEYLKSHEAVEWVIPFSLGDSHRGFRVLGTDGEYFEHFRYGRSRPLVFEYGQPFVGILQAVIGSEVARQLNYAVGDEIVLSHGIDAVSFQDHKDKKFKIVGVLRRTATPVDRTVHVSLESITAIHLDWKDGAPPRRGSEIGVEQLQAQELLPSDLTAALVGLKSKIAIFNVQREINEYSDEPLMAVLPGATFQQLWETVDVAENALLIVSLFVVLGGLLGMLTSLLASLNERRREMAILRALGAHASTIFGLLLFEAFFLCFVGVVLGVLALFLLLFITGPYLESQYGLVIQATWLSSKDWIMISGVLLLGGLLGCVPSWQAYRKSLVDGLMPKV